MGHDAIEFPNDPAPLRFAIAQRSEGAKVAAGSGAARRTWRVVAARSSGAAAARAGPSRASRPRAFWPARARHPPEREIAQSASARTAGAHGGRDPGPRRHSHARPVSRRRSSTRGVRAPAAPATNGRTVRECLVLDGQNCSGWLW